MIILLLLIAPLRQYLSMGEYVERQFAQYLFYVALAMPAALMYRALHAFASSLNRPQPIMWINWAALLLNIPLNYWFIFGMNMGGAGAGLATLMVFCFSTIALFVYITKNTYLREFGLSKCFRLPEIAAQKQIWHLGWAIGLSYFLEASLFSFIVWLISMWWGVGIMYAYIFTALPYTFSCTVYQRYFGYPHWRNHYDFCRFFPSI